jgi:hypothetical protein
LAVLDRRVLLVGLLHFRWGFVYWFVYCILRMAWIHGKADSDGGWNQDFGLLGGMDWLQDTFFLFFASWVRGYGYWHWYWMGWGLHDMDRHMRTISVHHSTLYDRWDWDTLLYRYVR